MVVRINTQLLPILRNITRLSKQTKEDGGDHRPLNASALTPPLAARTLRPRANVEAKLVRLTRTTERWES
jgi:hypothetical protein